MPHLPEHRAEGSLEGLLQTGTPVSPRSKHPGAPGCRGGKFTVAGSETSGGSPEKAGSPSLIRFTVLRFVSADQTERIYPPNCLGQRARQKLGLPFPQTPPVWPSSLTWTLKWDALCLCLLIHEHGPPLSKPHGSPLSRGKAQTPVWEGKGGLLGLALPSSEGSTLTLATFPHLQGTRVPAALNLFS